MEHATKPPTASVVDQHLALTELALETSPDDVQAILNLGSAVLLHGLLEPACLQAVLRIVDPAVRQQLNDDHDGLRADLALLAELHRGEEAAGEAGDTQALAAALHARLRQHVERDDRTLYRPLGRLLQFPEAGSEESHG
jgi:hypothetical protein